MNKISLKTFLVQEVNHGKCFNFSSVVYRILCNPPSRFVLLFRIASILREKHVRFIPGMIMRHLAYRYGCYISLNSIIGLGIKFPHPNGIVIGDRVCIGTNCTIYHQVTLGGKIIGDAKNGNYPLIGNSVIIFSGAKLIGNIKIGDYSVIGANSVVNKDVPPYSVVAGVPAKIMKCNWYEKS